MAGTNGMRIACAWRRMAADGGLALAGKTVDSYISVVAPRARAGGVGPPTARLLTIMRWCRWAIMGCCSTTCGIRARQEFDTRASSCAPWAEVLEVSILHTMPVVRRARMDAARQLHVGSNLWGFLSSPAMSSTSVKPARKTTTQALTYGLSQQHIKGHADHQGLAASAEAGAGMPSGSPPSQLTPWRLLVWHPQSVPPPSA